MLLVCPRQCLLVILPLSWSGGFSALCVPALDQDEDGVLDPDHN